MIVSWRERWGIPEFPFLFVQLANFMPRPTQPGSNWAELREAQTMTLELPHTGMAVAIDVGDGGRHPPEKQAGRRPPARAERAGDRLPSRGGICEPASSEVQPQDGKLRITLRNAEGLKTTDGAAPKGFAIAGDDRKFHWARAEIAGDHVIVQSPEVPNPVAVRYAWENNPDVNLVNGAGLPASPFRSDDWPTQPAAPAATK